MIHFLQTNDSEDEARKKVCREITEASEKLFDNIERARPSINRLFARVFLKSPVPGSASHRRFLRRVEKRATEWENQ